MFVLLCQTSAAVHTNTFFKDPIQTTLNDYINLLKQKLIDLTLSFSQRGSLGPLWDLLEDGGKISRRESSNAREGQLVRR